MPRREKKTEYQRISAWEPDDEDASYILSGYIQFTPEFLENILETEDVDEYGKITLRFALFDNEYAEDSERAPHYTGTVSKRPPKRQKTKRRRRYDEDDEEEDEKPAAKRRRR